MKRFVLIAAFAFCTLAAAAQTTDEVRAVPTDSLVRKLRKDYGQKIFYPADAQDKTVLTFKADTKDFVRAALAELCGKGYTICRYDSGIYVLRGSGLAADLPAGYFSEGGSARGEDYLKFVEDANAVASFSNKVYEIGDKLNPKTSGKCYFSGNVRNVANGEPLPGVAVISGGAFAMTDSYGHFSIALPAGENSVSFQGYSLDDMTLSLMIYGDGSLDVLMKETVQSLDGAIVSAESASNHMTAAMGVTKINASVARTIPAAFGEADIMKAVLTLPGVKTVGEASSGFNVRGGSSDQNLILFNDGTIYNPSHMFGIMSAFNTDVISGAELYKSSIPAEFGGRISSVLDIKGRTGSNKKVTGSLGLGLLTSRLSLEGPLGSEKTTFVLGARTTYSNWMLARLPEDSGYNGGKASFQDINLGISHRFDERNSIHAFAYWSQDNFSFSADTTFHYSNANASLKWRHTISDRSSMTLTGGYDRYFNKLEQIENPYNAFAYSTLIQQGYLKGAFSSTLADVHTLKYGADVTYYNLNPGKKDPLIERSLVAHDELPAERAVQPSLYVSDSWIPGGMFILDGGIRLSSFMAFEDTPKFYVHPEFRLSGKFTPVPSLSIKAGVNTMTQYINLISNSSAISPMDTWKLCSSRMRPQTGWQVASGIYWTIPGGKGEMSMEGYYKRSYHGIDYKSGAVLTMNHNLIDELVETTGKAYGVELMAKKSFGKLSGWVSYTWSRSFLKETRDRGIETINGGDWYNAPHDKPHDFKLVGNYKFTHRLSLSCNIDYSTGRPVTIPVGVYHYGSGYRLAYSERNAYRIPDYFRMDLAVIIEPSHYLKKLTHFSMTFGCYNVTGRKNAYSVFYTTDGGVDVKGHMISVFATQIPYVNFNLKF